MLNPNKQQHLVKSCSSLQAKGIVSTTLPYKSVNVVNLVPLACEDESFYKPDIPLMNFSSIAYAHHYVIGSTVNVLKICTVKS